MRRLLAILAGVLCIAAAPDPADMLADPAQEARARHLFAQTRCVVCQNESIDDSQAELAHDLRQLIRGQIAAGKSDAEIKSFLFSKYGDFISLTPRLTPANALLWGGPFVIVLAGLGVLLWRRRRPNETEPPLSDVEIAELETVIERTDNI
ncbi:cytochrome c-type biogenesis protein CcmH [soil metagenome]